MRHDGHDPTRPAGDELPAWAGFFTSHEQLDALYDAVRRYFASQAIAVEIGDGTVQPAHEDFPGPLGLSNIGQVCAASPRAEWGAIVANHFDTMRAVMRSPMQNGEAIMTMARARSSLAIRLWDETTESIREIRAPKRAFIPGLVAVLCIDLPQAIKSVSQEELAAWDESEDELFEQAIRNAVDTVAPEFAEHDLGEAGAGAKIVAVTADSYFTAVLALDLNTLRDRFGRLGAFVSLPTRHMILFTPLDTPEHLSAIGPLANITLQAERAGPGSVSARVWWVHNDQWYPIEYEMDAEQMRVSMPAELAEAIAELGGEAGP